MGAIDFIIYDNKNVNVNIEFVNQFVRVKYRGENETTHVIETSPDLQSIGSSRVSSILSRDQIKRYKMYTYILNYHRMTVNDASFNASQPFEDPIKHMLLTYPALRKRPNRKLLCNGEIYNYTDIIQSHGFTEKDLSSQCDVEVILPLYIKHQGDIIKTLTELDGEFSLVITDNIQSFVFSDTFVYTARDYLGIKPLFYITNNTNDFFMFVSEMKQVPLFIVNNNSYFIQQVPPGSFWDFKNPDVFTKYDDIQDYTTLDKCTILDTDPDSLNDVYTNIRSLVTNAVISRYHNCCNSPQSFGLLLSGGFDSCLMTSVLLRELQLMHHDCDDCHIHLFTIGDNIGREKLDKHYAIEFVQFIVDKYPHLKIHHHIVNINDINILTDDIKTIIYHLETFDPDTIRESIIYYYLFKYISEKTDVRVLLSGDGLDELGGYSNFENLNHQQFQEKSVKLLLNLCQFDMLRSDRMSVAFKLELRQPFLQKDFVKYMLSIHPSLKQSQIYKNTDEPIEKYLLRKSFDTKVANFTYLPYNILYRRTKCICDNITNFYSRLTNHFDTFIDEQTYQKLLTQFGNYTKEELYYQQVFNEFFPGRQSLVPYFWNDIWSD